MHVTLVHVQVKPAYIEDFITATRLNHEASIKEPGNRRFDVLQLPDNPGQFLLYEAYDSPEAAAAHKQTSHYLTWRETVENWMSEPRQRYPLSRPFSKRLKNPMQFPPFTISRLPRIIYGTGRLKEVPKLAASYGSTALVITGKQSFCESPRWQSFTDSLKASDVKWLHCTVSGEPSPTLVDEAVSQFREEAVEVVIGIGGGSVLDAAKAIAGLLPHGNSVMDHLEGVGRNIPYQGPSLPFIAVPTTAGTGSEATKNAVLSLQGPQGFKKSFRDDCLVPEYAVIDPDLLASCPRELIAADGMDAFTQLLESYVSLKANPFTDALAWSGMSAVKEGLFAAWEGKEPFASEGRGAMAYAALLSGITLAQVGLGSVHGLASPLGAYFPIPHGVVCGKLVAAATSTNIKAMQERDPDNASLAKYAKVGRLLSGRTGIDDATARSSLTALLSEWSQHLELPSLGNYGISSTDLPLVVANSRGSSMQTNPIALTDSEINNILVQCI